MISRKKNLPAQPDKSHFLDRWSCHKASPQPALSDQADLKPKPEEVEESGNRPRVQTNPQQSVELAFDRLALRALFLQADCSTLDGLNEYDEDYTFFSPRGNVLTQDMQRAADRFWQALATNAAVGGDAPEGTAHLPVTGSQLSADSAEPASQPDQADEQA